MPAWVLVLSQDSLSSSGLEQSVRMAGFSPRRAPDLARTEVLLRQGEDPAAAVVDLVSAGEDGMAVLESLSGRTALIAIALDPASDLSLRATRWGAEVVAPGEIRAALPPLLSRVVKDEANRTETGQNETT